VSTNASNKYSPFEILYGMRPKFPIALSSLEIHFKSMSPDVHHYISQQSEKLKIIRDEVQENATKAGESMKEREKQKINPLRLDIDDYVYILKDPTGRKGN
jgi:CRISPR/Cas system-associated protein Cas10 (large subunit of type III CRISPR-Cas system)